MSSIPKLILFLPLCSLFLTLSCEKNATPFDKPTSQIDLTVEEVTCTEAWLRLKVEDPPEDASFQLLRGDSAVAEGPLTTTDTLLYDEGLLPNQSYRYRAFMMKDEKRIARSEERTATTMDTTSHDFSWELIEIPSPYGSGALYDIALVSEFEAWAVGEIYADSAQPWRAYNAVHITIAPGGGVQWELRRIPYIYNGSPIISSLSWLYAQNENDIWFSNSVHWDGQNFKNADIAISIFSGIGINKMWGNPDTGELYVVGNQGKIAWSPDHGQSWKKLESGTELPIQDIWGAINLKTDEEEIICVASNKYLNEGKKVLLIAGNQLISLPDNGLSWSLSGVWFVPGKKYYIVGAGIFQKKTIESNSDWVRYDPGHVTNYFSNRIRGVGLNDIAATGAFGEIVHFNGISWQNFYSQTQLNAGSYFGLDMKNNLLVAGGQINQMGVIAIGRR